MTMIAACGLSFRSAFKTFRLSVPRSQSSEIDEMMTFACSTPACSSVARFEMSPKMLLHAPLAQLLEDGRVEVDDREVLALGQSNT